MRRWRALSRLREQRREHAAQQRAMKTARAIARGEPKHRGRFAIVAVPLGLFGVLLLLAMLLYGARGGARMVYQSWNENTAAATPATPVPPVTGGTRWVFSTVRTPAKYYSYVSRGEPGWVHTASVDRDAARAELDERIMTLRTFAPLSEEDRMGATDVPSFEVYPAERRALDVVRPRVDEIVRTRPYDRELANRIAADAPHSLVVLAQELASVDWQQSGAFERATHLQQLLQDATHCIYLPVYGYASMSPQDLARRNSKLGDLWLWFVNEFAHTPRTWATFRSLLEK